MGSEQRIGSMIMHIFACFFTCTIVSSPIIPTVSQTTCSRLVACCMRLWAEIRFQPDIGDSRVWPEEALDCLAHLQSLIEKVGDEHYDGLTRENVEYIIHLVDRIGAECDTAAESYGSEVLQKEFLTMLTQLWIQLRYVMVEV